MNEPTVPVDLAVDIYEHAKAHSTFEDTISTVLRRLLDLPDPDAPGEPRRGVDLGEPISRSEAARVSRPATIRRARKRGGSGTTRKRAAAGTLLPESEYHRPILEFLQERGGRAPKNDVIEEVGRRLDGRLTENDRLPLESGGIRWQSRTQFARLRLVDRTLMDREAPRGIWAITPEGIKALEEGTV